jgi:hypothetical protein
MERVKRKCDSAGSRHKCPGENHQSATKTKRSVVPTAANVTLVDENWGVSIPILSDLLRSSTMFSIHRHFGWVQ